MSQELAQVTNCFVVCQEGKFLDRFLVWDNFVTLNFQKTQCRIFPTDAGCWAGPRTMKEAEDLVLEREGFAQQVVNNITVCDVALD